MADGTKVNNYSGVLGMAGAGISAGIGLAMRGSNDRRQINQQQKLTDMQLMGQGKLNAFNQRLDMKTWEQTNYPAQREQMEKAGLNVGLMYGMGGGAGGQTGHAGGGVGIGQAPAGGRESEQGAQIAGMGMQMALMKAQVENINADTKVKNEDALNKAKGTRTGIDLDNELKKIELDIQSATTKEQKETIQFNAQKAYGEARSADAQGQLDMTESAFNAKIEQLRLITIKLGVEIEAEKAGVKLTEQQTNETTAKINKITAEIENMKNLTEIQRQEMLTRRLQEEFNTSTAAEIKQYTDIGTSILQAVKTTNVTINKGEKNYAPSSK